MSQDSYYQQPAPKPEPAKAARGARRWLVPSLMLTAIGLVALASCGPDNGAGGPAASNSAPSAGVNTASAGLQPAAPPTSLAPAPAAPACPKVVEPACPAAPPIARHAAAIWSGASRHGWRRHGRRSAYAEAARRWDEGRPWPGDRPDGERYGHRDDALMGGPAMGMRGGYRTEEESRFSERSDSSGFDGGERFVERYREETRGGRPCPLDCRGGLPGDWRGGGYRAAGVDERGYLVWPGKVEY